MAALADRLRRHRIRYAYFHVRRMTKEGALKYRYADRARRLVDSIRGAAPAIRALAWIYAGNRNGGGEIDLTNRAVRRRMVEEAVWLVKTCGFDGVQRNAPGAPLQWLRAQVTHPVTPARSAR